jgi:hypothetical protein
MRQVDVKELAWREPQLGGIDLPKARLELTAGFGSGLSSVTSGPRGLVWAISDRGPNLKIKDARKVYGWEAPDCWKEADGAKLMPRPDIGPTLALLEVGEDAVTVRQTLRLVDSRGRQISGLPIPESGHANCEPAVDLYGSLIPSDQSGMDTEGLALLPDGSFWISEEYGPSIVKVDSSGKVVRRLVPKGVSLPGAGYAVQDSLPAIGARRHLNRGFEAIAAPPSSAYLYVAFQSPLAHPTKAEHEQARHVRLWQLDPDGEVLAQFLYPLDEPKSFGRDWAAGKVNRGDLKVCEIVAISDDRLLVLERASETSKIYHVALTPEAVLHPEHLDVETRPSVEELSCDGVSLPELRKELLFTSDDWLIVGSDIEGMTMLDEQSLLIVSDNDFGCEGKKTRFYRLCFSEPF